MGVVVTFLAIYSQPRRRTKFWLDIFTKGKEQLNYQKKSTSDTCVYAPDLAYMGNDDEAVRVLSVHYIVSEV
jgi:hypothetical protein